MRQRQRQTNKIAAKVRSLKEQNVYCFQGYFLLIICFSCCGYLWRRRNKVDEVVPRALWIIWAFVRCLNWQLFNLLVVAVENEVWTNKWRLSPLQWEKSNRKMYNFAWQWIWKWSTSDTNFCWFMLQMNTHKKPNRSLCLSRSPYNARTIRNGLCARPLWKEGEMS